ncbi:MAG: family 78 glycoside hydrolase catalytic domain, partial [Clostridia bacterium]|nr:family 78 glycoside hydrolase catalytic domain [Clostridia bacterium]
MGWIRADMQEGYPVFVRRFAMKAGDRGLLRITGLGLYRAYLNGHRVGEDFLTPGFNDYSAYVRRRSYDVSALLVQGENVLEVYLGEGWYMGRLGMSSGPDRHFGDTLMLHATLELTSQTGEGQVICTDEAWEAYRSPVTMCSIYDGEYRDDTLLRTYLGHAVLASSEGIGEIEEDSTPPIRVVEERKPVKLRDARGDTVLDFGQNFSGIIRFHNTLPRGKTVLLQTGEVMEHGAFFRDNLLTAKSEFRYTSDGAEKDVEAMFTFFGFRYVRVTCDIDMDASAFTALVLSCDLPETLHIRTGHAGLNRLLENSRWSRLSNFLDVPTDCPQRDERLGWTGDAQVFAHTALLQADCRDFYRKYLRDLREDQVRYYAGDLPMFCPSLKGMAGVGGAVWADVGVILPLELYQTYGETRLLEENWELMRDYTEVRIRKDREAGFTHTRFDEFSFGDWLALDGLGPKSVFGGTETAYIQGAYYLQAVEITGKAAEILGKAEAAARYLSLAREIREALMEMYVTAGGRLSVDTQTGYILALRHGLFRDREVMREDFRRRLQRDHYEIACGFTGAPLLIGTLFDEGMVDEAYRILFSEEAPGWLYEVRMGATTIWERWNSLEADGSVSDTGMDSFNHYAYGSVSAAVYEHIAGLSCASPGWREARIAPCIRAYLKNCQLRYQSPAGTWEVAWSILPGGEVTLEAHVPEGCSATLLLPDDEQGRTLELTAGTASFRYRPVRDYLHPFDGNSLIL